MFWGFPPLRLFSISLATFPLDLTKTRLQMQGEAALARLGDGAVGSTPYRGMVRTALGIVQEEGFLKLWQGVTPAIYRHVVYSGGRMVTYEHLREVVFGKSEDKHYPLWKSVIGGMMAGVIGQFLANPTDLVKVQMQMEGKRRLEGKPLRFRGVHHAFAKILAEGGIRGLWAGWIPNIQRAALVNMGDLTTYDTVKHYLVLNTPLEDNISTHGLSSLCSGLVASILGTPADVIKSRIMNQPRDKQGRGLLYKSSTDCLIQAVQGEGFLSLYKGFLPSWLRMVKIGKLCFFLSFCFLCISITCTLQIFFIFSTDVWHGLACTRGPFILPFLSVYYRIVGFCFFFFSVTVSLASCFLS
ncbi:mitochondrial uncoupling protein 4 isoform X2 [Apodemus sylvaticus]|uniref:mitochondrial uncoupling protein 4 isoform X2 n=1 Tax=Apodemus sylvaticus TaxID=10129 RepID=UPI002244C3D7|nr:mitochondrial uncoupling protein 4 isoform X2 [Apodemus sylvaticus]